MEVAEQSTVAREGSLQASGHTQPDETIAANSLADTEPTTTSDSASQQLQAEPETKRNSKKMAQRKKKRVTVKTTPRKSKWNAENIMIDSKSPLATCDLRTVLSNPTAWDVLDANDRAEILGLFPDQEHIIATETDGHRPNFQTLLNDDSFRHDCATYTENVAEGRHDPEWLAQAWAAHERRKTGEFDDYLVKKFEDDWEVKLPEELKPRRPTVPAAQEQAEKEEGNAQRQEETK